MRAVLTPDRRRVRELVFGPFRVDTVYCQLWRDEQLVALTPKAFDTLVFLIGHRDHIVSKEEVMAAVWPNSFVSEDALTSNIWAIRRALGDDADKQEFIATIPRRGYRFTATVVEVQADPDSGTVRPTEERETISQPDAVADAEIPVPDHSPVVSEELAKAADSEALVQPAAVRTVAAGRLPWYALAAAAVLVAVAWVVADSQRANQSEASLSRSVRFTQESPRGATLVSGGVLSPDTIPHLNSAAHIVNIYFCTLFAIVDR